MMETDNKILQQGWECPKCGAVMSPTTSVCVNCDGRVEVSVNGCGSNTSNPYAGLSKEIIRELAKLEGRLMDK